jgi:hypothetical protein
MSGPAPPKGNGALSRAPTPPTILAQLNCGRAIVQHVCDPSALVCSAQDHCWIPKPETLARQRFNAFRLVKLAMCDRLSPWERMFVRDVSQRRKLSPKQLAIIDRLCAQYLEAAK